MQDRHVAPEEQPAMSGNDKRADGMGAGQNKRRQKIATQLAEIEARSEDLQRAIRNALGESEYARYRAEADLAHAYRFAIEGFALALLPLKDALETALDIETSDAKALKAGIALGLRQLETAFVRNGLLEICPQSGERFNAEKHKSLTPGRGGETSWVVAATERKGYELNGRVIRAAAVILRREK